MNQLLYWILAAAVAVVLGLLWLRLRLRQQRDEARRREAELEAFTAMEAARRGHAGSKSEQELRLAATREAAEEAARQEREALELAHLEAERLELERVEAERLAALEAAQLAAAAAARAEAERAEASLAAQRLEAERLAAEAAAKAEAERLAQEEALRQQAEAAARAEAERLAAEAAAKAEAERLAQQEALRQQAEAAARAEAERMAAEAAAAAAQAAAPVRTRKLTPQETIVMVVDDSKVVRVKTNRLLAPQGYRVVMAESAEEAIEKIAAEVPHVLITDVEMPGLDGFELTRHVRATPHTAALPVVMITSADDRQAAASAAGVSLLLGKPYPEEKLIAYIEGVRETVQVAEPAGA